MLNASPTLLRTRINNVAEPFHLYLTTLIISAAILHAWHPSEWLAVLFLPSSHPARSNEDKFPEAGMYIRRVSPRSAS
ncbi:hypothetical protein [Paenibacillus sp. MER TA 81-3]|uniref:hypothetical protein n=1 Tax=Paenibacillus sp. MER TA 81-3 TaxID=2939573 RepID=UPI00203DD4C7|nr:hypothetical protein [Paenibacillus sp. MER TA 81-3]